MTSCRSFVCSSRALPNDLRQRLQKEIGALLDVDPAEKQKTTLVRKVREFLKEGPPLHGLVALWADRSIVNNAFVTLVEPERLAREPALLLRGEEDGRCIAQDAIVRPEPVKPFLQMLQRVGAFEPGIEHPMGEHKIGRGRSLQRQPYAKGAELPDAVDNDDVVVPPVGAEPGNEPRRVPVAAQGNGPWRGS